MTEITHEALEALSKKATQGVWEVETDPYGAPFPGIVYPGSPFEFADFSVGENGDENQANAELCIALVNLYRTGQLIHAVPSGDEVERLVPKDYASIKAELAHIVPCYSEPTGCLLSDEENEQRCEDGCFILSVYKAGATAAITAYEAVSGVAKMRDALKKIATVDESGLAEYTPQAMVAIARAALGEQP